MPEPRLLPGEPLWALLCTKQATETIANLEPAERAALVALDSEKHPWRTWRPLFRRFFLFWAILVFATAAWWLGPVRGAAAFFGLSGGALLILAAKDLAQKPGPSLRALASEVALLLAGTRHARERGYGEMELLGAGLAGDNGGEVTS